MDDNWRPLDDMPTEVSVLFIEGFCQVPFYQNEFWTCDTVATMGGRPFDAVNTYRVWCTDPSFLDSKDIQPDAFGMDQCIKEIESGKYHAIVVVDFSNNEYSKEFDDNLGDHIQKFVAAGGVVAFPATESVVVNSLKKMFDIKWKRSSYFRTTWSPCKENMEKINYSFGNGNMARRLINPYSSKSNTLKSVPVHERCFGVGENSTTESLVPTMRGRDVSRGDSDDDDYDISVAMHEHGKGSIVYFGDVNAEVQTLFLVADFIHSRTPKLPIDILSNLSESEFLQVSKLKEEGNAEFGASNLDLSKVKYESALDIYGQSLGSNGDQRDTYITLFSNLSLVCLKKKLYEEAEIAAGKGLDAKWGHNKCAYRRAMARLQISLNTNGGDLTRLRGAIKDVISTDPSEQTRVLLLRLEHEKKKLEKRERKKFGSRFASAITGTL